MRQIINFSNFVESSKQIKPMSFRSITPLFACLCCFFCTLATAQPVFTEYEDSLRVIAREIQKGRDDFVKLNASERFCNLLINTLQENNSFEYPFDSLKSISRLTSDDHKIRIFTWTIAKNDGSFDFGGVLQVKLKKGKEPVVYKLEDHSADIQNPENQILSCDNWYGALYYRLIEKTFDEHTYYTLLGWDGNNPVSRKKLIEILTLTPGGKPVFGASLFSRFPRKCKRIIFEYSATSTMTLNYSTQLLDVRVKKGKKRVVKKEVSEMIVFDRLSPLNSSVEGQHQFYFPETNIQDGFIFDNGRWNYAREVDARNNPKGPSLKPYRKPEFELFPPGEDEKK